MNAVSKQEAAAVALPLTLPERAAVALGTAAHEIKLHELLTNSAGILSITNKAGRDECHTAYMVLKNARCSITNLADDATEDAKAFTKAVKAESLRLHAITEAEEARLQLLRDGYDEAEQARKDALIAQERARTDAIQADIQAIRDLVPQVAGKSSEEISEAIFDLAAIIVTQGRFDGFEPAAIQAVAATGDKLGEMLDAALASEAAFLADQIARIAEAARVAAELAQLAADKAELAESQRVAADTKRQLDEQQASIAADRAAFARETAEAEARKDAAIKLSADQDEAIVDNFKFEIAAINEMQRAYDAAADLARCTETAKAMHTQGRSLVGASLAAYADAGLDADDEPTIDIEAIAWAYRKLLAFGVGGSNMHSAMMMDRLNAMLTAEVVA